MEAELEEQRKSPLDVVLKRQGGGCFCMAGGLAYPAF